MSAPAPAPAKAGHGDHWLAALPPGDSRLLDALAPPLDAPEGIALHRAPLTEALDMVQVTARRRLVTAYPEPRATALLALRPRELLLWETRVEAWLVAEHEGAGALTLFLTDLAENATRYQAAGRRGGIRLEVGALAYALAKSPPSDTMGPERLVPASHADARFLPDDYSFEALVRAVHEAGDGEVLDLVFQGGLELPVAWRERSGATPGDRVQGYLWLTGRVPEAVSLGQ